MLAVASYATFDRAPYFSDRRAVAIVSTQFLRAASENSCEILTYGFTPDGARLLFDAGDARAFVAASRRRAARVFRIRTGQRLWSRDLTVLPCPDVQTAAASARYILSMPFSGSFAWDRLEELLHARIRRHA